MNSVSGISSRCPNVWIVRNSSSVPFLNLNRRNSRASGGGARRSSMASAEPKSAARQKTISSRERRKHLQLTYG